MINGPRLPTYALHLRRQPLRANSNMLIVENSVDTFHDWDKTQPYWTETFWYGAWIPKVATTVYLYSWFRPVLGIYGGGCLVWDDKEYLPWDIPVFHYDVNRPLLAPADLRSLNLDCGTRLRTIEEGHRYEMSYSRRDIEVAMRFDAVTPPEIVTAKGMSEFFNGHIDQAGHYRGYVRIGDRRHEIDCFGIRDRSWGPRVMTDEIRMNYCHGQSEELAFVSYSRPGGTQEDVFKGYLSRDGRRVNLAGGSRRCIYRNSVLLQIDIDLTDAEGRRMIGTGMPLNRMVYEPYPNLITWLYLMKWRIGEDTIYGEEQDVWSIPLWHARNRNARL
jgi:hypothetical protein